MNKKKYFIAEDDEQKGPFSFNELKEIGISKTSLIWKEGFDDWTEAGKIEELQILLKITPPKLPKNKDKKENKDKTLNVNLGLGKPKTTLQLKEKELAKEKIKVSVAKNTVYYINRILISILFIAIFLIFSNYIKPPQYIEPGQISEEYIVFSTSTEYLFLILLILCFFIIFGRPLSQIFNWFKTNSEKDI